MSDNENIDINNSNSDLIKVLSVLLTVAMKYGIPFVLDVLENIKEEKITEEDIENLKIEKDPESYFPDYNK